MESNRPRVAQRRTYRLRNPERGTQTFTVQKPPSEKLDSCVQVWVVKEEPKVKMTRIELVNRHVQCIVPSLPGRLILLLALLAALCGMASYMTKGDIYHSPMQSVHGQVRNLRDTFVEIMWAIANPVISYLQTKR